MKKTLFLIIGAVLVGGLVTTLFFWLGTKPFTAEINKLNQEEATIGSKTFTVEVARTPVEQAQGLSNRDDLASGSGMLFVLDSREPTTFWMKDMKFPLDIIWIKDQRVYKITKNLPVSKKGTKQDDLPRYEAEEGVGYALEVNAGESEGIEEGDLFNLTSSIEL